MKIIIDVNVVNDAIQRECSDRNRCEGWVSCMNCAGIEKNDFIEIDEKIQTEQIID